MITEATTAKSLDPNFCGHLTVDEIIAYGLPYKHLPQAKSCEYCGNLLEPVGVVVSGLVIQWRSPDCDCDRAKVDVAERMRQSLRAQKRLWAEQQARAAQQKGAEEKTEFTLSELKGRNYPLDPTRTPSPIVCEFCGKETDPTAIVFGGLALWKPTYCDCKDGIAKHQADVDEQERKAVEAEARKQQAELDERVREILIDSGIKKRFMSRTFDSFLRDTPQREKAYADAKYYADNFADSFSRDGTGIYLEGTFGTGKTHLAVAIALCLIRQGVNVICKTSIDLLMDIKAMFRYDDGEEVETARYKRCALLVIDDLGKEQCTDWSLAKLYEIINDRYEKCKPTVITTNYSHDELIRRLVPKGGDSKTAGALVSRMKESAIVIDMIWDDWREMR